MRYVLFLVLAFISGAVDSADRTLFELMKPMGAPGTVATDYWEGTVNEPELRDLYNYGRRK